MAVNYVMYRDIVDWLIVHGYAEERSGYGHVSADELAEALLNRYEVTLRTDHGDN